MTTAEREETFRNALPALLQSHAGKYALVCDGQILVFEEHWPAVKAGFQTFGHTNFLVAPIEQPTLAKSRCG